MKPLEKNGTFQYERAYCPVAKRERVVWGYKDKKGIVHSGIVDSPDEALEKAKRCGYQPNETAESRSQHDLVGKSNTHFVKNIKLPEETDGYQPSETTESKSQHDLVGISNTHFIKNMIPPEEADTFQHEPYYSLLAKRQRIVWDYMDKRGILHSGIVDSIDEALEKAKRFGFQPDETVENRAKRD
jgi:hypothetical protein